MRNKITLVLFDKFCNNRSLTKLRTQNTTYDDKEETKIEVFAFPDSKNLEEKLSSCRGYDSIITVGNINDYPELFGKSIEIRRVWSHFNEFDPEGIVNSVIANFKSNLNRPKDTTSPIFSICTCAYKTSEEMAMRLYNSLLSQTYSNWNWWILEDSPEGEESYFTKIKDPRVIILKNVTNHGNIGFNKRILGMACNGDYIVEVDHDDELSYDCLELLKKAFDTYKDCDFAYSYAIEEVDGRIVSYGDNYALGLGREEDVPFENDIIYKIPITPDINVLSLRHIVGVPNHVRCWKKDFYVKIGGHNENLSVCDDFELLVRTALNGKMCKIPKILYIQHEGNTETSSRGSTTQAKRFGEIVRTGAIIKEKYDPIIHKYFIDRGMKDPYWIEGFNFSNIWDGPKEGTENINYTLNI